MEKYCVGLDVSKGETAVCVRSQAGEIVAAFTKVTDPDVLSKSLTPWLGRIDCIVLETGRMAN
jgi:20S proteasome alpha/beta subunit